MNRIAALILLKKGKFNRKFDFPTKSQDKLSTNVKRCHNKSQGNSKKNQQLKSLSQMINAINMDFNLLLELTNSHSFPKGIP